MWGIGWKVARTTSGTQTKSLGNRHILGQRQNENSVGIWNEIPIWAKDRLKIPQSRKEPLICCHKENETTSISGPQVEPENHTFREEIETMSGNTA